MKRQPSEQEKVLQMQLNIKKNKQPNQKMGIRPKQLFLQRRHTDGQPTHEKILDITSYQRNANPNYSEILPLTYQNGHHL